MLKISIVLINLFLTSCASTTVLRTRPLGADVFVDGIKVGKTPYEYTDQKWYFGKTEIEIKKEGYESYRRVLHRNENIDWGALLGLVSIPWAGKYSSEYLFHLKPIGK